MKRNDDGERYAIAKSQGLQEAGILCNSQGIARVENALSQIQQNQFLASTIASSTLGVINSQNVNQQKTDAGLAVIASQTGLINATLNSILLPRAVATESTTTA